LAAPKIIEELIDKFDSDPAFMVSRSARRETYPAEILGLAGRGS